MRDLKAYLASSGNPPVHSLAEIVNGGLVDVSLEAGDASPHGFEGPRLG